MVSLRKARVQSLLRELDLLRGANAILAEDAVRARVQSQDYCGMCGGAARWNLGSAGGRECLVSVCTLCRSVRKDDETHWTMSPAPVPAICWDWAQGFLT